jgi:beta-glucosidase
MPNTPLFPFGYGLSYTTYSYSDIKLDTSVIAVKDTITATVTVKNTGDMAGEEIVQLYIRDLVGSITRPVKELKDFKKIRLDPGESKEVSFTIDSGDLSFYNAKNQFRAEPGKFNLFIGPDSENVKMAEFELK